MRATISISDELLAAAKRLARDRGQTLEEVIDAALQRELSDTSDSRPVPTVPVFRGGTGQLRDRHARPRLRPVPVGTPPELGEPLSGGL
jgi:hypothetical protein